MLLTDLMMPGTSGVQLLRQARAIAPDLIGVILTGQGTPEAEAEAARAGASGLVRKPFRMSQIRTVLDRAFEARGLDAVGHSAPPDRPTID